MRLKFCAGFALLESLVAMLLLATGVLAFMWTLQKGFTVQRQNVFRENAMRLADNMAQRMLMFNSPNHARDWGMSSATATQNCKTQPCSETQWVSWLLQQTNEELKQLPQGDMAISPLQAWPNSWVITVGWRDTAETFRNDNAWGGSACPAEKSCWRLVFRTH
jgi:type IV pilus modification protein PilV